MFKNKIEKNIENNCNENNTKILKRSRFSLLVLLVIALSCSTIVLSCELDVADIPSEDEILAPIDDSGDSDKSVDNSEGQGDNTEEQDSGDETDGNEEDEILISDNLFFIEMDTSKIESSVDYLSESEKLRDKYWTMIDNSGNFTRDSSTLKIYEKDNKITSMRFSYDGSEFFSRVTPYSTHIDITSSEYKGYIIKVDNDILYLFNDVGSFRFKVL